MCILSMSTPSRPAAHSDTVIMLWAFRRIVRAVLPCLVTTPPLQYHNSVQYIIMYRHSFFFFFFFFNNHIVLKQ